MDLVIIVLLILALLFQVLWKTYQRFLQRRAARRLPLVAVRPSESTRPGHGAPPPDQPMQGSSQTLSIDLACVYCGAPVAVHDDDDSLICSHCTSWLVVRRGVDYDVLLMESRMKGPEDAIGLVADRRLDELRFADNRRALAIDEEGSEARTQRLLAEEGEALAGCLSVGPRRRLLHVPYWHREGLLCAGLIGRQGDSSAGAFRLKGTRWRHSAPAHEADLPSFRDQGVDMAMSSCRLLRSAPEAPGEVLPVASSGPDGGLVAWRPNIVSRVGDHDELSGIDADVWTRSYLVLKPYWIVQLIERQSRRSRDNPFRFEGTSRSWWCLVDATRRRIAATLGDEEVDSLLGASAQAAPCSARPTELRLISSRCPECGVDQEPQPASARICPNCHQGLQVRHEGRLTRLAWSHDAGAAPERGTPGWFPFWRFSFTLTAQGHEPITRIEEIRQLSETGNESRAGGRWLWVPAVRLLGDESGDAAFMDLVRWAAHSGLGERVVERRLGPEEPLGEIVQPSLTEWEARALARSVLATELEGPTALRLTSPLFRRQLLQAKLELGAARLVLARAAFERNAWHLPGLARSLPWTLVGPGLDS